MFEEPGSRYPGRMRFTRLKVVAFAGCIGAIGLIGCSSNPSTAGSGGSGAASTGGTGAGGAGGADSGAAGASGAPQTGGAAGTAGGSSTGGSAGASGAAGAAGAAGMIGPGGGTVAGDGASVDIPAGALSSNVAIAVTKLTSAQAAALAPFNVPRYISSTSSSGYFAFTPHGTQFAKPVTVKIPYTGSGTFVARLDNESDTTWEIVPGATFSNGVATFQMSHFSVLGVFNCGGNTSCCTPYASCSEALTADVWDFCGPAIPDGCGATMDCSADSNCSPEAGMATKCMWVVDSAYPAGGTHSCEIPCASKSDCPPAAPQTCVDSTTITWDNWSCTTDGYCSGVAGQTSCPSQTPNCVNGSCV